MGELNLILRKKSSVAFKNIRREAKSKKKYLFQMVFDGGELKNNWQFKNNQSNKYKKGISKNVL